MSNPHTWNALKQIGLIPKQTKILEGNINPQLKIELEDGVDKDEMKLYKIEASNWETFFGTPEERIERDVITIAQHQVVMLFCYLLKTPLMD